MDNNETRGSRKLNIRCVPVDENFWVSCYRLKPDRQVHVSMAIRVVAFNGST